MDSVNQKDKTLILTGLTSAILFGAATPASKLLLNQIQPQQLAGLLYLGAAIGVLPLLLKEKTFRWPWQAGRQTVFFLGGAVLLGGLMGPLLLLLALKTTSSGSVSLWLNLEFVATVALGHFFFHDSLSRRGWAAASLTFVAALLLAGGRTGGGFWPVILIIGGCICWGFDNHLTSLIDGISPAQTTFWKGIVAGAFNTVMGGMISGGVGGFSTIAVAIVVGAFSYGLSITLYVTSAQGLGATRSQMIFSTAPFFGLLLSVTALGEPLTLAQILSSALIIVSLVLIFTEQHRHLHLHDYIFHQHVHEHNGLYHDHNHGNASGRHIHWHEHRPTEHSHKHWPDLHHRHDHEDDPDSEPPKK